MTKRKAIVLARVEAKISPSAEQSQPLTVTEDSQPSEAPNTIEVGSPGTRRVPGAGDTLLQGEARPTATITPTGEPIVGPAYGARGSSDIDVANSVDVDTYPATGLPNTQGATRPPT